MVTFFFTQKYNIKTLGFCNTASTYFKVQTPLGLSCCHAAKTQQVTISHFTQRKTASLRILLAQIAVMNQMDSQNQTHPHPKCSLTLYTCILPAGIIRILHLFLNFSVGSHEVGKQTTSWSPVLYIHLHTNHTNVHVLPEKKIKIMPA